ncbi:MAG: DUF2752 domain-containing protein [Nitrospinae bacterium]|nr:DUF2752 domain-containing protein [Nitrospinota bacterium]
MKLPDISKEWRFANIGIACLLFIALLFPFTIVLSGNTPNTTWYSPTCFVRQHTGMPCQTCGLTRSIVAFYRGEWDNSLRYHKSGMLIIVVGLIELFLRPLPLLVQHSWFPWVDMLQFILVGVFVKLDILFLH